METLGRRNFANDTVMEAELERVRKELLSRTAEEYRDDKFARRRLSAGLAQLAGPRRKGGCSMSLINRRKVKELALALSRQTRAGKFTRVSSGFLNRIESRLRAVVAEEVRSTRVISRQASAVYNPPQDISSGHGTHPPLTRASLCWADHRSGDVEAVAFVFPLNSEQPTAPKQSMKRTINIDLRKADPLGIDLEIARDRAVDQFRQARNTGEADPSRPGWYQHNQERDRLLSNARYTRELLRVIARLAGPEATRKIKALRWAVSVDSMGLPLQSAGLSPGEKQ